ncbi:hypothetical protein SSBR45G_67170 [Bradyrhizobium sp. SSBR45G]|uniref:hypothetical protein n=1 Tax=unclassified Bradyrhizobium TaxID=2631580 RepID=UPI002342930F|nr:MULTISPECIES: hypothetical protein [unclassified Bradyrhizobium]GLH81808.1 hypothetical protein SSBR45G_67170 [Bradyrhizobium sp. SSBR45G]GLH85589.1 hypothetical protein SSBR45R_30490 [Bradyrhizobium sp. SSBR45R]
MAQLHLTSSSKVLASKANASQPGGSKTGWLAMAAGVLTTVFATIGAVNSVIPAASNIGAAVLETLNLPACLTYPDRFGGTQSSFRKEGNIWREYPRGAETFTYEFKEIRRTRQEIMLWNVTPRSNVPDAASLVVHLPVCGGMAVLTEGLPERSTNLEQIWPDRS